MRIEINNRLLLSSDFWKSMKMIMEDKSFDIKTKLKLSRIKGELAIKIDDIQGILDGLDDQERMKLYKLTSIIESDKVKLSEDDVHGFSSEDLYNLNSILILED